jgi:PAS domain S-box-containing protein
MGGSERVTGDLLPALFEAVPFGIALYDASLRFLDVNDAFAAMSGRARPDHVGRHVSEVLPQLQAQIVPLVEEVFARGRPIKDVNLTGWRDPDAPREGHWLASYHPVSSGGRVTAAMAVVTDVSARRRAEAVVKTQRDVLESGLAGAPLSSILDRIAAAITEYSSDGAIPSIQLLEDDRLHHGAAGALPRPYVEAIEGVRIGPDAGSCGTAAFTGRSVFVSDIASDPLWRDHRDVALQHGLRACWSMPILGVHGGVLGTFALYYNTPRAPSAEDVMLIDVMARTTAMLIEWRRAEEARERMLAAEKAARAAAEDAGRSKEEFVANLSHELRTPLNAIMGWSQMLRMRGVEPAMAERAIAAIERNAEAQARLIDDLLDMARIARGKLKLVIAPVELAAILDAALDTVRPLAGTKGVRLTSGRVPAGLIVEGDATRLRQVIWNVLSNAIKFTPAGGEVTVDVRPGAGTVTIGVTDTGVGIAPELLPHIFDRYRQGDGTMGGLGLGLAIARHVAELHDGALNAASEGPGRGARFEVVLPTRVPTAAGSGRSE